MCIQRPGFPLHSNSKLKQPISSAGLELRRTLEKSESRGSGGAAWENLIWNLLNTSSGVKILSRNTGRKTAWTVQFANPFTSVLQSYLKKDTLIGLSASWEGVISGNRIRLNMEPSNRRWYSPENFALSTKLSLSISFLHAHLKKPNRNPGWRWENP
ncbi:hypothetical protein RvY_18692 [Ramazzottius varieornatus]|uniref:Uncharacterized protein n=1 Tax=Ramazzottius varieornatus TaxID=947166 RepID=A0A1D1W6P6_RAMVA|nr:hypothetical protein RvY_18692 [Ramazzottius varieornatus]